MSMEDRVCTRSHRTTTMTMLVTVDMTMARKREARMRIEFF